MARSVAVLKVELQEWIDKRAEAGRARDAAGRQYAIGLVGLLIGAAGLYFGFLFIGGILFVAGALAAVTNYIRKRSADGRYNEANEFIKSLRRQIADQESR